MEDQAQPQPQPHSHPNLQPLLLSGSIDPRRRLSIPHSRSEEEASTPLTPRRQSQRTAKIYQIDQAALERYKRVLQKRVAWTFVLLFIVIIERIFAGYTRDDENKIIGSLQESLGITYDSSNWSLQPIVFIENYLYFILLVTHYFVIVYYFYNAVICLKIMFITLNTGALVAMFEIIFGDPRPYWDDDSIVAVGCVDSYGFPSFTIFCVLFLFMYSWHCFQEDDDDDESVWDTTDVLKGGLFVIIFGFFCFCKIISGVDYIGQTLMSILYSALIYYMCIFFDKTITGLVERSTIDIQIAKKYSIYWMIYLLIFAGIATITYETSDTFLNIDWFSNYFNCMEKQNQTHVLKDTPYYHLIGAWGSFLKTGILFAVMGAVFGASKAFRDFKGVLWYDTTKRNRAIMTAVASLCVLPSWIIVFFQPLFIGYFQSGGIDPYLFNAFHLLLLYFVVFGVLPKLVFDRYNLLNKDSGYYFVADELIRIDSNAS